MEINLIFAASFKHPETRKQIVTKGQYVTPERMAELVAAGFDSIPVGPVMPTGVEPTTSAECAEWRMLSE